jgi:hypothetical protein
MWKLPSAASYYKRKMLRQLLAVIAITALFSCKRTVQTVDTRNKVDTSLRILIYGLYEREQDRAMNTVAQKYDFRYYHVAGCVISEHLLDSVNKENKRIYKILEQRFGKNWRFTFAEEVETMENLQEQVETLVKKESYITVKENELEKDGNGLDYSIDPIEGQKTFAVKAYGWGQWHDKTELVIYYQLTVNLTKKTVVKNSDVIEKLYNHCQ